ncbi:thioredoxin family protein [Paenibacillus solisilvae]|uniref:Thioredoxin n=1 Tax=Paenibacillus solisilvae TaxID=2486751 RepID=A0ABW0W7W9_9BACL
MIQEVSEAELQEHIRTTGVPLIEFGTLWCPPCRTLLPILDELANDLSDEAVTIIQINCDSSPHAAAAHGVMSTPTVVLYKDGQAVDKLVGLRPKGIYKSLIDQHLIEADRS